MSNKRKSKLTKLLAAVVSALVLLVCIISFSADVRVPTWTDIVYALTNSKTVSQDDFIRFIDVGQGDSILICSNGYSAIIDFGDNTDDGKGLMSSLRSYGIKECDCMIVSHYDADHIGGADTVIKQMKVENVIIPEQKNENSKAYREFKEALDTCEAKVYEAQVGTVINIGDFELTILAFYGNEATTNDRSVVVMAEIDGVKFLFTGDVSSDVEEQLLKDGLLLDCDVFKAGHHGSRYSNSLSFLEELTPAYVVVSCGLLNSYGHPHDEAISNFYESGAKVYRTDQNGDVTFFVENGILRPVLEKE